MAEKSVYATAEDHSRMGTKKASLGTVNGFTTRSFTFEVNVDPIEDYDYDGADEFVLIVNGHLVKRFNQFQARRMGLIR